MLAIKSLLLRQEEVLTCLVKQIQHIVGHHWPGRFGFSTLGQFHLLINVVLKSDAIIARLPLRLKKQMSWLYAHLNFFARTDYL